MNHKFPNQPHELEQEHSIHKKPNAENTEHEIITDVIIPKPVHVATTTKSDVGEFYFSSTTLETSSEKSHHQHHHQVKFETTTKNHIDPRIMNFDSIDVDEINEIDERSDENIIF